eukprot:scaffold20552_cov63-Phaeocystis_antarctica.AAC.2
MSPHARFMLRVTSPSTAAPMPSAAAAASGRVAAAAAGALVTFSTRLPTCHPQKSSESDSSRSEWTPQSSRHSATVSRSGRVAFVFDVGAGSNGIRLSSPAARSARNSSASVEDAANFSSTARDFEARRRARSCLALGS